MRPRLLALTATPLANSVNGVVILLGHVVTLLAALYVGTLLYVAAKAGSDPLAAWATFTQLFARLTGD